MGQPLPVPPGFDDLPVERKIDYVQFLWDRIAADASELPLADWHRDLLQERLAEHEARPEDSVSWEEVRERLDRRFPNPE